MIGAVPGGLDGGRDGADGCPGVLRPHLAQDGLLVRVRLPGGALPVAALRGLADASLRWADGRIGLTSRANLQLRGVDEASLDELEAVLTGLGLLPSPAHDGVRNLLASPLSGRRPGAGQDVDALLSDLDAALCRRPRLAALPGRFLFAVDDGSGDVAAQRPDVLLIAAGGAQVAVRAAGMATGLLVPEESAVAAALDLAEAFLDERPADAWRISEVPGGAERISARLLSAGWPAEPPEPRPGAAAGQVPPGLVEQRDGRCAVCAIVPLGLLNAGQAEALAAAAELSAAPSDGPRAPLRVTPWRRVLIRDLELPAALAAGELLAALGLVTEPGTPWERLSACAGRPGCARALRDVHADLRTALPGVRPHGPALHWVGCERGCGTPPGAVQVVASADGYQLSESAGLPPEDLAAIGALP